MTDDTLIDLANQAGLCYPECWNLPDKSHTRMEHLRRFAELVLQQADSENHGQA